MLHVAALFYFLGNKSSGQGVHKDMLSILADQQRPHMSPNGSCGVGYKEFDFSLENEEHIPLGGCKIEI
jgi:hypothetical protein